VGRGPGPADEHHPPLDLVITHGATTRHRGAALRQADDRAAAVLDQYDNAQRMDELGYGVRLDTYTFEEREMHVAIERLLADTPLRERMASEARRSAAVTARRGPPT